MARLNQTITITAGTPVNLSTGLSSAQMLTAGFKSIPQKMINRMFLQALIGGSGVVYVMSGIRGITSAVQQWRVPSHSVSTDLTAQLAAASASAPGGSYSDTDNDHGIDLSQCWVDGSNTADTVQISYDTRT